MAVDTDSALAAPRYGRAERLLPMLLRGAGAAALAAAVLGLLLREWSDASELYRYLLLLALTIGVALLGLLSGRIIGDGKGARLLVTAGLAAVPANFAVLGALWLVDPGGMLLAVGGVAALLLAGVALTGFLVLARPLATRFAVLYTLSGAVLLLPTRELDLLALPTAGLAVLALLYATRTHTRHLLPDTPGSRVARVLLFLPLAVLLGRSFWFYSPDAAYLLITLLIVYAVLHQASLALPAGPARKLLELVAVPVALAAGVACASWLTWVAPLTWLSTWVSPAGALLSAALLYGLSGRACAGGSAYRALAAAVLSLMMVVNLLLMPGSGAALACLLIGLWLAVHGYLLRQRLMLGTGAFLLFAGLLHQALRLLALFEWGNWGTLAALGVTAILLGSALERYGPRLRARLHHWRDEFGRWEN